MEIMLKNCWSTLSNRANFLCGKEFLVYNVHSMVHLADEAKEYGCLDECSAFPFENHMQKLKKLVRSGKSPIVQVEKRINELSGAIPPIHHPATISLTQPDNAYILTTSSCCEVVDKLGNHDGDGNETYLCRVYERCSALFTTP